MGVSVDEQGPLFDGRLDKALKEAQDKSEERVARLGAQMVRSQLNRVLRTQTPHYRLQVTPQPDAPGWKVTDGGVIYGPWLEGIGSRNAPVTRFKGYHSFRIVTGELQGRAKMIVEGVYVQYLGRL